MEPEKYLVIGEAADKVQYISTSRSLGQLLLRPEVDEIISNYGSRFHWDPASSSINIVPPIPRQSLPELAEALVELAAKLDPAHQRPTYDIF